MIKKTKKSVLAEARSWAMKRNLFGTQAFLRYVILRFTEELNLASTDFIFKGGNLLWVYIDTPRATTDLDLETYKITSHQQVRRLLERVCDLDSDIQFSLLKFKEIEKDGKSAASVTIRYTTNQGATNSFDLDIVYALGSDSCEIDSPINAEIKIHSATLENIICDKLAACHRFKSGNTRMKDFDDLWRISKQGEKIDVKKLKKLFKSKSIEAKLDLAWINNEAEIAWRSHIAKYDDLPNNLTILFKEVNKWLSGL